MSLAARVVTALESHGMKGAVIGGAALAVHGVARATADLDLLTTDEGALDAALWEAAGIAADVRRGDHDDPLAGVVHLRAGGEIVDVVVGRPGWMSGIVERASARELAAGRLPVVEAADLVLLKLYAAGPQDLLDVRLLVAATPEIRPGVESRLGALPPDARTAWERS